MRSARLLRYGAAFAFSTALAAASAQPPEPAPGADDSKPVVKDAELIPSTFRSFIVTDKRTDTKDPLNRTNKLHCLVCENNLNPVVAVFARSQPSAEDPLAKLVVELKKLLAVDKYKAQNLASFVIFATLEKDFQSDDKRDLYAGAIRSWGETVGAGGVVLGLTGESNAAVKAWNLNKDDDITVVLYQRMKMVRKPWTFGAGKMADEDVKAIVAATEAELGKK